MLKAEENMAKTKHSYTQTGSGVHKIGVTIDILSTPRAPKPTRATVASNRLKVVTPLSKVKPVPKYHIDIQAIHRNIDKLAMAEHMKHDGMTPRDLYYKTNPGLLGSAMDYTDPRQWYSSTSSKKMMKKLTKNMDDSSNKRKAKSSDHDKIKHKDQAAVPLQTAFYVNFPNLPKLDTMVKDDSGTHQHTGTDNTHDKLPHLINTEHRPKHTESIREKTQIQIRSFSPNIEESQTLSSARKRDLYGSTESLDSIGKQTKQKQHKHKIKQTKHSDLRLPRFDVHVYREPIEAETPPSALDRELTKSMEDILRSVTASDNVHRSLRQPTNISIKLPQLNPEGKDQDVNKDWIKEESRTTSVNWETGVGLRKTYSYQSLNDYSQPLYRGSEHEQSTRIVKTTSNESLLQSRDKFKKLRVPQQKAVMEELTSFRNNYNLRQKSQLKLKLRPGFDVDKVPMNKIQVSKNHPHDEYEAVPSKIAQYIETKAPQRYVVAPDGKGHINPVQLSPENSKLTQPVYASNIEEPVIEAVVCPGTSFSQLPNDDSSEVHTLITHKSEDENHKKEKSGRKTERSRSRSRSINRSRSRSKSRDDSKPRKGTLSRGSTISKHSKEDSKSKKEDVKSRSVSREDVKREGNKSRSEVSRPQPSARSPSSKTVHLPPATTKRKQDHIPPPSHKAYTRSYIPPKLKKHKHTYADSLDTLIREHGKESRSVYVSLALKEKAVKHRRKQLIRAFDKYLITKFGDKVFPTDDFDSSTEDNEERPVRHELSTLFPRPPAEPGKRPVFRRMKTLVPFDERGRPITRGKEKPVVNEDFPTKEYKPTIRPPSYRLDLRQYPPNKPNHLIRDITFDKRQGTIINHGLERGMSFGELSFPDKKTEMEISRSNNASTLSNLIHSRLKHGKKHHSKHHKGRGGGRGAKSDKMTESDIDSKFDSDQDGSRYQTDTPADSISASMMKEIYDSLNDYLEEEREQGTQYDPGPQEILMEG